MPARLPLSADELDAVELFLRRTRLSPLREEELAAIVAPIYARRMNGRHLLTSEVPVDQRLSLIDQRIGHDKPLSARTRRWTRQDAAPPEPCS